MNIRCYFGIICCLISTTFRYSLNLQILKQEDLGGEWIEQPLPTREILVQVPVLPQFFTIF